MGLYSGGLIIGRIFASEIRGAYFLGEGALLSEFYGMISTTDVECPMWKLMYIPLYSFVFLSFTVNASDPCMQKHILNGAVSRHFRSNSGTGNW